MKTIVKISHLAFISFLFFCTVEMTGQILKCDSPSLPNACGIEGPFNPNWASYISPGKKYIPAVVHLIGTSANNSDAEVLGLIAHLNADFNSANPSFDIDFVLAGYAPDGKCTNGITRYPNLNPDPNNSTSIFNMTRWPNQKYLNIWIFDIIEGNSGILGWTPMKPIDYKEISGAIQQTDRIAGQGICFDIPDGVVVKRDLLNFPYDANHALTHEVGHWLGLHHTFVPENPGNTYWDNCHPASQGQQFFKF